MTLLQRAYRFQHDARARVVGTWYGALLRGGLIDVRPAGPVERVLVVLAGHIGDTVMCTPVLLGARRLWPSARLTVLGRAHNRDLLIGFPAVTDFIEARAFPFSLRHGDEVARLTSELREARFDVGILSLGDQFAATLVRASIPVRVGVRGTPLEACLTHAYEIGNQMTWGPDERLNALRVLGHEVGSIAPRLWVSDAGRAALSQRLAALGVRSDEPIAVLHPFGSTRRQWIELDQIGPLAERMAAAVGGLTFLVGGAEVRSALPGAFGPHVVDTIGTMPLPELVAVMDRAAVVVTTDSGPYHIAGALGRPLVGLFRSTRPEYGKLYARSMTLFGVHERCVLECTWDRCARFPCRQMSSLDSVAVVNAVATVTQQASHESQ